MTVEALQWLVGTAITVVVAIGGIAFTAFRAVNAKLDKSVGELRTAVKDGDDMLHERVNRLRQDVSDNYVRRVDLDGHMTRMDSMLKEVRDDQKKIIEQIARIGAGRRQSGN